MKYILKVNKKEIIADIHTPVEIYIKIRSKYVNSLLLESSEYSGIENSKSIICFNQIASIKVADNQVYKAYPNSEEIIYNTSSISSEITDFISSFESSIDDDFIGFYGYTSYDSVKYFENIVLAHDNYNKYKIPEIMYNLYSNLIVFDHYYNKIVIYELLYGNEESRINEIEKIIKYSHISINKFVLNNSEKSNIADEYYLQCVEKAKSHCKRGDVFQLVLSRQFQQDFIGDEFNVYRALRSINPSPYLFYFDFTEFKIMGSSPEAQIVVEKEKIKINPIAGTYKRTGNKSEDLALAFKLLNDPKENSEHTMLIDLARNDLSIIGDNVKVEKKSEVQYYSHVIHLVSEVTAKPKSKINSFEIFAKTFPAGTLTGAPKYKAMQLIDKYENQNRGFYGGAIGYIGLNNTLNHAIMIRSFLSKNNVLYYQAGAGIVMNSCEMSELEEVNNKLLALKKALIISEKI